MQREFNAFQSSTIDDLQLSRFSYSDGGERLENWMGKAWHRINLPGHQYASISIRKDPTCRWAFSLIIWPTGSVAEWPIGAQMADLKFSAGARSPVRHFYFLPYFRKWQRADAAQIWARDDLIKSGNCDSFMRLIRSLGIRRHAAFNTQTWGMKKKCL